MVAEPKLLTQCLRKKKLSMDHAKKIIKRAARDGVTLYMYGCPHCTGFHLTKNSWNRRTENWKQK